MKNTKILFLLLAALFTIYGCGGDGSLDPTRDTDTTTNDTQVFIAFVSPITGKTWMAKNLGAEQICTSPTDTKCYGDLYQWGRSAAGHQKRDSSVSTAHIDENATSDNENFISGMNNDGDWAISDDDGVLRAEYWRRTDGTGICPTGFRVPTYAEFVAEMSQGLANATNAQEMFDVGLKLPMAGYRNSIDKLDIRDANIVGNYWTTSRTIDRKASIIFFDGGADEDEQHTWQDSAFAMGLSVRCIKH